MRSANAIKVHRKSGGAERRDLRFVPDGKTSLDEGHGFSRAEKDCPMRGFSP